MRVPGKEFVRFLLRFKVEALLLLLLSAAASGLGIPLWLTLASGLLILVIGTFASYRRQTTEETGKFLRDLSRLVDDFDNCCFQGKPEVEDFRILKLLDKMSFPSPGPTAAALSEKKWHVGNEEGVATVAGVKEIHLTFQLWLSSLKQKLRLLTKIGRMAGKNDLYFAIVEFSDFYNNYVDRVAEKTVWLGNRAKIDDRQGAKSIFNIFRDNLSHLRDRVNTFLKDFQSSSSSGFMMNEVKAMKSDLEIL